jgi:hypothetical protein
MEAHVLADHHREASAALVFGQWFGQAYALLPKQVFREFSEMVDNGHRAKVPENTANITLSGQKCKLING